MGLAAALLAGLFVSGPAWSSANGLIVKMRDESPSAKSRVDSALAKAGFKGKARGLGARSKQLDFGRRLSSEEAAQLARKLAALPDVEWAVPNEREGRLAVPQDPLFAASVSSSGQWWLFGAGGSNLNDIDDRRRGVPGVQSAWQISQGGRGVVVAVLDTGVTAHPDLSRGLLPGRDFVSTLEYANDGDGWDGDPSDPGDWVSEADRQASPALFGGCDVSDSSWHGTVIAGLLAADTDNGTGVAAVNWAGRVLPVRVAGKCGADLADILVGMRWAAGLPVYDDQGQTVPVNGNPARVINLSFGGSGPCNAAYADTIEELARAGVVVVAAAGNQHGAVSRPANCPGVIGVAALNRDGFKSSYSNFGPQVTVATVGGDPRMLGQWGMALGDDGLMVLSNQGTTQPGQGSYTREAGTSFAAPVVAGVAGLMLGVNPALTAAQIIDGLQRSARPHVVSPKMGQCSELNPGRCICDTSTCGAGVLDAASALEYALNPTGYVAPARQPEVIDNADLDAAIALGADRDANRAVAFGNPRATAEDAGGALGLGWLAALAAAVAALSCRRPRSRGPAPASAAR